LVAAPKYEFFFRRHAEPSEGGSFSTERIDIWAVLPLAAWQRASEAAVMPIDMCIAQCVRNDAGYRDQVEADRQRERFEALRAQGVLGVFQQYRVHTRVDFGWTRWARDVIASTAESLGIDESDVTEYSSCDVDLPRSNGDLPAAIALYQHLTATMRRMAKGRLSVLVKPEAVLATLRRLKAVELFHEGSPGEPYARGELCTRANRPAVEYTLRT
jgi:hypothetical protein